MIVLFAIAVLLAFVALVLASRLSDPAWRWALDGLVINLAVATLSGLGLITARLRLPDWLKPHLLPSLSAVIAFGTQQWLVAWLAPPEPIPRIDLLRLQLAALSAVGAAFAIVGGVVALSKSGAWYHLATAGATVAVGLFSLGPLLLQAGVPVDWRTFVSLAGLGLGVFAVVEAARRVRTQ